MNLNLPWTVRSNDDGTASLTTSTGFLVADKLSRDQVKTIADLTVAYDKLLSAVKSIAKGVGHLSLEQLGGANVHSINDGKMHAIYLECYVNTSRDVLKEIGERS